MAQKKDMDSAVFEGIRKTISRFRRKPFHYFTEADIHSSLLRDIIDAAPDLTIFRPSFFDNELGHLNHISVSLVHQEYPTHFRYKKNLLLNGYRSKSEVEKTLLNYTDENDKACGDRGNFDLAVLNKEFVLKMLKTNDLTNALEEIIHKDISRARKRFKDTPDKFKEELLFAIEVKFIHAFNARNIEMLYEVIKDDQKLRLAHYNSGGNIKPVNLVFCSSPPKKSRGGISPVIELIKDYISEGKVEDRDGVPFVHPDEIVTIFIESFIEDEKGENNMPTSKKQTLKPQVSKNPPVWARPLIEGLKL